MKSYSYPGPTPTDPQTQRPYVKIWLMTRITVNTGELEPEATSAKFAQVQSEGGRTVNRQVYSFVRLELTMPVEVNP